MSRRVSGARHSSDQGSAEPLPLCDICEKRNEVKISAVVYCTTCAKKFCTDHHKPHKDLYDGHSTIPIASYIMKADKLAVRYCNDHGTEPYTLGCPICNNIFCFNCISFTNLCSTGRPHELIKLSELESIFKDRFNQKCENILVKEKEFEKKHEDVAQRASMYKEETADLVNSLHQLRDEQIQEITRRFKTAEEELLSSRSKTQDQLDAFREHVKSLVLEMNTQRKKVETSFKCSHQVDIVLKSDKMLKKCEQLAEMDVKTCRIQNTKIKFESEKRNIVSAKIVSAEDIHIGYKSTQIIPTAPSESIEPTFLFPVSSFCHSICQALGNFYIGTQNSTIEMIDGDLKVKALIALPKKGWPYGLVHSEEKLFILLSGDNIKYCTINIHNLNGQFISSWTRKDICHYIRPAILQDKLVVPDLAKNQLSIYSLRGVVIKTVPEIPLTQGASYSGASVCAVNFYTVVVTCCNTSLVIKVNIESGKIVWTCHSVAQPHGVAVYNAENVCVVSEGKLSFININTGTVIKVFSSDKLKVADGHKMAIEIFNNTVMVSAEGNSLYFYNIEI